MSSRAGASARSRLVLGALGLGCAACVAVMACGGRDQSEPLGTTSVGTYACGGTAIPYCDDTGLIESSCCTDAAPCMRPASFCDLGDGGCTLGACAPSDAGATSDAASKLDAG